MVTNVRSHIVPQGPNDSVDVHSRGQAGKARMIPSYAMCSIWVVAACGGATAEHDGDGGGTTDAAADIDGGILDGGSGCEPGAAQCSDAVSYRVCGDDGSGATSFGPRLPCQSGSSCDMGRCDGRCVVPEILIVLDRSSSMADSWEWVTNEVAGFVETEQRFARLGLRQFPADGAACEAEPILAMSTDNAPAIEATFHEPTVSAQTPLVAALSDVTAAFGDPAEAQYILLITDGDETCSDADLFNLVERLARDGVDTFAIGIGNGANPATIDSIAKAGRTGPQGYTVTDAGELTAALTDVADRTRRCVCEPAATECIGSEFRACSADGLAFSGETCAADSNQCTNDACDPRLGCTWLDTTLACDDGNECTVSDSCSSGSCGGTPVSCWSALSTAGAPTARRQHAAVWTGTEMLVWGGTGEEGRLNTGGRYDPASDTWSPISTVGAPSARDGHTAIWTGTEMIVWGGYDGVTGNGYTNTGGRYDPASDTWSALVTSGAPDPRIQHTAVWTGTEMIVWGGQNPSYGGVLNTGGRYNPGTNAWLATALTDAPTGRVRHSAVWSGAAMLIWGGGNSNTGGRYSPATDSWTSTSTASAPSARNNHNAVWSGSVMIVWGGGTNTGGRYDPLGDSWSPTATGGAPVARSNSTAVWTGDRMIIWGGTPGPRDDGGEYTPGSDAWSATTLGGAPSGRTAHTAVWTGEEMLVWGGSGTTITNTGAAYDPL